MKLPQKSLFLISLERVQKYPPKKRRQFRKIMVKNKAKRTQLERVQISDFQIRIVLELGPEFMCMTYLENGPFSVSKVSYIALVFLLQLFAELPFDLLLLTIFSLDFNLAIFQPVESWRFFLVARRVEHEVLVEACTEWLERLSHAIDCQDIELSRSNTK